MDLKRVYMRYRICCIFSPYIYSTVHVLMLQSVCLSVCFIYILYLCLSVTICSKTSEGGKDSQFLWLCSQLWKLSPRITCAFACKAFILLSLRNYECFPIFLCTLKSFALWMFLWYFVCVSVGLLVSPSVCMCLSWHVLLMTLLLTTTGPGDPAG